MIRIPRVFLNSPISELPRGFRKAQKWAGFEMVREWHKTMLPKHFAHGAEHRYGYKERGAKYQRRKKHRRISRGRPLVWSGLTERQAKRFMFVRGTSTRVVGEMTVPWYVTMKRRAQNAPNMADEITRTTKPEADKLAEIHKRRVLADAQPPKRTIVHLSAA